MKTGLTDFYVPFFYIFLFYKYQFFKKILKTMDLLCQMCRL